MSDIIVRIPETQLSHFVDDKLTSDTAFWRFSKRPRKLDDGDYIFFSLPEGVVYAGEVQAMAERSDLAGLDLIIDSPGNFNAFWRGDKTHKFKRPISSINYGQRGFRYLTAAEQRRLRGLVQ